MNFVESIKMAFTSLTINKLRSVLTMLGIIIGISAVITITTIGNSISSTLNNTFNQLGTSTVTIWPDMRPEYDGKWEDLPEDLELTLADVQGLIAEHPDELTYSATDLFAGATIMNPQNEEFSAMMVGVSSDFFEAPAYKKQIVEGRAPNAADNEGQKNTVLVSDFFCDQYFGTTKDVIGKTIKFDTTNGMNVKLTVIGVLEYTDLEKNELKINTTKNKYDVKTYVYFPYNTKLKFEATTPAETKMNSAEIGWTAQCDSETAKQYINEYFEDKYKDSEQWCIHIYDLKEQLGMINTVLTVITVAISVIAAISLIVGGVGVMNIMLVSILERTREIGVRKALGALNTDIRSQFVIEAIIICLTGGLIGVLIGIVNGFIISKVAAVVLNTMASEYADYISVSVQPSIPAIVISLGFAMLTGLIFGYYPAKRAGNMNPIDALRYE